MNTSPQFAIREMKLNKGKARPANGKEIPTTEMEAKLREPESLIHSQWRNKDQVNLCPRILEFLGVEGKRKENWHMKMLVK